MYAKPPPPPPDVSLKLNLIGICFLITAVSLTRPVFQKRFGRTVEMQSVTS